MAEGQKWSQPAVVVSVTETPPKSGHERRLTSSLGDLEVTGGQVLLHVLLEGFLQQLVSVLQLQLPAAAAAAAAGRGIGGRRLGHMVAIHLHCKSNKVLELCCTFLFLCSFKKMFVLFITA